MSVNGGTDTPDALKASVSTPEPVTGIEPATSRLQGEHPRHVGLTGVSQWRRGFTDPLESTPCATDTFGESSIVNVQRIHHSAIMVC